MSPGPAHGLWFLRFAERERAEHRPVPAGLTDAAESGLTDKTGQQALGVVRCRSETVERLHQQEGCPHPAVMRLSPIGEVQFPARSQDTKHFAQSAQLVFAREVVEEEA